jgi:hypothetical protein
VAAFYARWILEEEEARIASETAHGMAFSLSGPINLGKPEV